MRTFPEIDSRSWEHPADRAALNAMRALPGFDDVVRRVVGFFGERGVRNFFLANAVRVGPTQRPKLDALYTEVLATFDVKDRPDLYVTQTPYANALAVGLERPFIVINSGTLALLDREEQRFVLAHEIGHVLSGHTTYTTLAQLLLQVGIGGLPFLAGIALLPFQLALLEWYRKAEFSADRAGLLGVQDLTPAAGTMLKFAGGGAGDDTIDINTFLAQAAEYETGGTAWDSVLKALNTVFRDHPFATIRAAELQRWAQGPAYPAILDGTYIKRSDPKPPLENDVSEAADYYGDQFKSAMSGVTDTIDRAKRAFEDAFRGASGGQ
ncbi:MAG: M48 family metallopeptidase [Gemmatimonadaceae bacterium]|nr:M48 family metallopeptidase [Gemmatimonadaceae bacterium]